MIAYIKGTILTKATGHLVVVASGVGYKVAVPAALLLDAKTGQEISLHIFSYIREDQFSLYGFLTQNELEIFEMLISVSGIGPKMALSILSTTSVEHIRGAIAAGEAVMFTKISGIGRKTAERLIVELREKIGEAGSGPLNLAGSKELSESLDALVALGYSRQEARDALSRTPKDLQDSGQIIKAALKLLGGR